MSLATDLINIRSEELKRQIKFLKIKLDINGFSHLETISALAVIAVIAVLGVHILNISHADTTGYTPMGNGYMCNPTPSHPSCSSSYYTSIYSGYVCRYTTTNSTGTHYWIKGYATITSGSSFPSQTGAQFLFYKNSAESSQDYLTALPATESLTTQKENTISVGYQPIDRLLSDYNVSLGSIYFRFVLQSSTYNFTPLPLTLNSVSHQYIKIVPC